MWRDRLDHGISRRLGATPGMHTRRGGVNFPESRFVNQGYRRIHATAKMPDPSWVSSNTLTRDASKT